MQGIFSEDKIKRSRELLDKATRILITTHKSPDGDAIGSSMSLMKLLKNAGYEVQVVLPDPAPDFLQWIPGYETCLNFQNDTEAAKEFLLAADLIFALDYNNLSRTGAAMEAVLRSCSAPMIMIDHHHQPEALFVVQFSDTESCSTCQMIYEWILAADLGKFIDLKVAAGVYCGIMTDSGSFRFPLVNSRTHHIVADLMEMGLDHAEIHRNVYDNNLLDRMKLVGYAISEKLEVLKDCGTALIWLNKEELDRFAYQPGDTEGLVNQALSIQGVRLAAFFREGNNELKISLRSIGDFDVNGYARKSWNGGGHKNAAGGNSLEKMEDALARFRKEAIELKNEIINS